MMLCVCVHMYMGVCVGRPEINIASLRDDSPTYFSKVLLYHNMCRGKEVYTCHFVESGFAVVEFDSSPLGAVSYTPLRAHETDS